MSNPLGRRVYCVPPQPTMFVASSGTMNPQVYVADPNVGQTWRQSVTYTTVQQMPVAHGVWVHTNTGSTFFPGATGVRFSSH